MSGREFVLTEHLASIVGEGYVHVEQGSINVFPANTDQVSAVLRYGNENGLVIRPAGNGTKPWRSSGRVDISVKLTRLNRLIEHPWQDLTCTVQAGCTWRMLQSLLGKCGQFVALDPLWEERATIGGVISTNDSGALRHRYGSLRDLVIGMTFVLSDGTIARSGGKVVKNVAGYDLCKLLTGSFGTLAVITEATFRLHSIPRHLRSFTISSPSAERLAPLMSKIRASHLLTQALQLRAEENGCHLDAQLSAHPDAKQDDVLHEMANSEGLKDESSSFDAWLKRESLFASPGYIVKITMLPVSVAAISDHVRLIGGRSVAQSLGVMYANFSDFNEEISKELSAQAQSAGGTIALVRGAAIGGEIFPRLHLPGRDSLSKAIQEQFDPKHTLNS